MSDLTIIGRKSSLDRLARWLRLDRGGRKYSRSSRRAVARAHYAPDWLQETAAERAAAWVARHHADHRRLAALTRQLILMATGPAAARFAFSNKPQPTPARHGSQQRQQTSALHSAPGSTAIATAAGPGRAAV